MLAVLILLMFTVAIFVSSTLRKNEPPGQLGFLNLDDMAS